MTTALLQLPLAIQPARQCANRYRHGQARCGQGAMEQLVYNHNALHAGPGAQDSRSLLLEPAANAALAEMVEMTRNSQ